MTVLVHSTVGILNHPASQFEALCVLHLNSRAIAEHYQCKRQPSLLGDNTAEGPVGTLAKWDDRGGTRCPCVVLPRLSFANFTCHTRIILEVESNGFLSLAILFLSYWLVPRSLLAQKIFVRKSYYI